VTAEVPGLDLCRELFRWSSEQMAAARVMASSAARQIELGNFERARDILVEAQRRLNSALAAKEVHARYCPR
jgi:hypothetical protein